MQFTSPNYTVMEGTNTNASITLESLEGHDFSFTVNVRTRDGSAKCEPSCHTCSATTMVIVSPFIIIIGQTIYLLAFGYLIERITILVM